MRRWLRAYHASKFISNVVHILYQYTRHPLQLSTYEWMHITEEQLSTFPRVQSCSWFWSLYEACLQSVVAHSYLIHYCWLWSYVATSVEGDYPGYHAVDMIRHDMTWRTWCAHDDLIWHHDMRCVLRPPRLLASYSHVTSRAGGFVYILCVIPSAEDDMLQTAGGLEWAGHLAQHGQPHT